MSKMPDIDYQQSGPDQAHLFLTGDWLSGHPAPELAPVLKQRWSPATPRHLIVDGSGIGAWNSLLVSALLKLFETARAAEVGIEFVRIPEGAERLLRLATAVPEREGARKAPQRGNLFHRIGEKSLTGWAQAVAMLAFIGQLTRSLGRLIRGEAQFRRIDLLLLIQQVGAEALPIVTLISVLVGMILAYVGAIQLTEFGAQIYIADLVGLGITREMGAMMTAVIMAGRSGAAFASQLGAMQVNEEVDALTTMGFSAIDFLVLPRMLALFFMMPLLCLYADFMGMFGGALVCALTLDISFFEYYVETQSVVGLDDIFAGLVKSVVFGALVALAGCLHGMQCGRNASAVGEATTSAVVLAIVLIVVADAILTIFYDAIGL